MKPKKYKNSKGEDRWQIQLYVVRDATGNSLNNQHMTIKQLYEVWHKDYAPTAEVSTLSKVESYYTNHILKDLGDQEVKQLKPYKLQRIVNLWAKEAKSGVVWARYLKKLYDYAIMHEYIAVSPFDKIQIPSISKNKHSSDNENVLNSEQLSRFLDYCSKQELNRYAYFRLLADSGMRRGEIIALTWGRTLIFKHAC